MEKKKTSLYQSSKTIHYKKNGKDDDKPTLKLKTNTSQKSSGKDNDKPTSEPKSNKSQKRNGKFTPESKSDKSQNSTGKDNHNPTSWLKSNESLKISRKDGHKPTSELKSKKKTPEKVQNMLTNVHQIWKSIMMVSQHLIGALCRLQQLNPKQWKKNVSSMQDVVHRDFNTISMYKARFMKSQLNLGEINVLALIGIFFVFLLQNLHQLGKEIILIHFWMLLIRYTGTWVLSDIRMWKTCLKLSFIISITRYMNISKTYTGGLWSADSSDGMSYVLSHSLDLCLTCNDGI